MIKFGRLAFVDLAALMRRVVAELNQRGNRAWVTGRGM